MRKIVPALLLVAVIVAGVLVFKGDSNKYIVYVKANDAGGILKNYNVKVGQVAAGKVTDISLDKQDHAVLKMELDKGAYPIGAGASAAIRPVNLLGEKYIDLNPGDLSRKQKSGVTIPATRTTTPIELDDALNILDPDTRAAMRIIINQAGLAMAGNGANFNATLESLPPAVDAAKRVVAQVRDENDKLAQLIDSGDRVLATVAPKSDDLGDLVKSAANALQSAAQRRENLGQTVRNAPGAINQLRSTLVKLQQASTQLSPAADDLKDTAPDLAATLRRVPQFTQDAKGTLAEISKVSPALQRLGTRSTPTLRELRPTADRLAQFTTDLQPFANTLDQGTGMKNFLGFINGWTSTTSQRDQLGYVFRLGPHVDTQAITQALQRTPGLPGYVGDKPAAKKEKKAKTPDAAPQISVPKDSSPAAPLKALTDPLKKSLDDVSSAVTNILTGGKKDGVNPPTASPPSSGSSVGKLLNYLLGS